MEVSFGIVASPDVSLSTFSTSQDKLAQDGDTLRPVQVLPAERKFLDTEEVLDRNVAADNYAVALLRPGDIAADICTHLLPEMRGVRDVVQDIGITCCLLISCPVEREPVGDVRMEVLQKSRYMLQFLDKCLQDFLPLRELSPIRERISIRGEPRSHRLCKEGHGYDAGTRRIDRKCRHDSLFLRRQQDIPMLFPAHNVEPPIAGINRNGGLREAQEAILFFGRHYWSYAL